MSRERLLLPRKKTKKEQAHQVRNGNGILARVWHPTPSLSLSLPNTPFLTFLLSLTSSACHSLSPIFLPLCVYSPIFLLPFCSLSPIFLLSYLSSASLSDHFFSSLIFSICTLSTISSSLTSLSALPLTRIFTLSNPPLCQFSVPATTLMV